MIEPRLDRGLLLAREAVNLDVSEQTRSTLLATVLRGSAAVGVFYGGDTGRRPCRYRPEPGREDAGRPVQRHRSRALRHLDLQATSHRFERRPRATRLQSRRIADRPPLGGERPDGSRTAAPSTCEIPARAVASDAPGRPSVWQPGRRLGPDRVLSDGGELFGLVVVLVSAPRRGLLQGRLHRPLGCRDGELLGPATKVSDGDAVGFGSHGDRKLVVSGDRTTIWDAHSMALLSDSSRSGGASTRWA